MGADVAAGTFAVKKKKIFQIFQKVSFTFFKDKILQERMWQYILFNIYHCPVTLEAVAGGQGVKHDM